MAAFGDHPRPNLGTVLGVAETGKEDIETRQEYTEDPPQHWHSSETEEQEVSVPASWDPCPGPRTSNVSVQADVRLRAHERLLGRNTAGTGGRCRF